MPCGDSTTPPGSTSPVGSLQPSPEGRGTLGSKRSESGTWSATISEPARAPQTQVDGSVSLSIPLSEAERLKVVYRNEAQALEPKAPCLGSPGQPVADPGNLCVYRGGGLGSRESEDKNARLVDFQTALGNSIASGAETEGVRRPHWHPDRLQDSRIQCGRETANASQRSKANRGWKLVLDGEIGLPRSPQQPRSPQTASSRLRNRLPPGLVVDYGFLTSMSSCAL